MALWDRLLGRAQKAPEPVAPAPEVVREPQPVLEVPFTVRSIEAARHHFRQAEPADLVRALGRPLGYDPPHLAPYPGQNRDLWIAQRVTESFSREDDYVTPRGPIGDGMRRAIDDVVRSESEKAPLGSGNMFERNYAVRATTSNRVVDFLEEGERLDRRIDAESEMLGRQPRAHVEQRFRASPIASFEPMPDAGMPKRAWIEDALRAEHAAARDGLMHPQDLVKAALAPRGEVPLQWKPVPLIQERGLDEARMEFEKEAARIERMPDQALRARFHDVPGVAAASVPPVGQAEDRRIWIETALMAQRIREPLRATAPAGQDLAEAVEMDRKVISDRIVREPRGPAIDVVPARAVQMAHIARQSGRAV